jgi:hypothetical protein
VSTAIEKRPVNLGAPVLDLDSAYRLSQALAMASVLPDRLRGKPADVLAIMLYGQDLGMSPMQALQGIYVVKGKPQLSSQTWTALARRAGHKVRQIESTAERCVIEITTKDDPEHPHRETYTIQDAATAKLVTIKEDGSLCARSQKGEPLPWETNPKTMLRNRAISNGAKLACPEVALGFAIEGDYDYIPDEVAVEVIPPETVAPEAVVVEPEKLAEEVTSLVGEFDFSTPVDGDVIEPEVPADYTCICGAVGAHFEDECPKAGEA